jgi:hypothetical protein
MVFNVFRWAALAERKKGKFLLLSEKNYRINSGFLCAFSWLKSLT